MSLRNTILKHSLPLIPRHSFTRQTLSLSLPSLPSDHPDHKPEINDTIIDTLFGQGIAAPKALVGAWQENGLENMEGEAVEDRLKSRLRYSAEVGAHLVEAYALMNSPESAGSLPIPKIPLSILNRFKIPQLYNPSHSPPQPTEPSLSNNTSTRINEEMDDVSRTLESLGNRIPLIAINPIGSLSYAWNIADAAQKPGERSRGITKGLMNEPTGSGPEWYASRLSLSLAYLGAESRLLQPFPSTYAGSSNPHLPSALTNLEGHLHRYHEASRVVDDGSKSAGYLMTYLEHLGRSAVSVKGVSALATAAPHSNLLYEQRVKI